MSNKNEVNEIFSYLSKNNEVSGERLSQIFSTIYTALGSQSTHNVQQVPKSLSKS